LHKDGVFRVVFSPDGKRLLSGGGDGMLRLWDVASRNLVVEWKAGTNTVYGVGFAADGRRAVSGGADRSLRLWELPR
jgi:WD40 repeat protein